MVSLEKWEGSELGRLERRGEGVGNCVSPRFHFFVSNVNEQNERAG